MTHKPVCKLCNRLILSQSVDFTAGNLVINIPAGSYSNNEVYCIVVAQAIPTETTISSLAFITIGDGTELYPLNQCNGVQATASGIRTRTRYAIKVTTTATGGAFRLLGKICCYPTDSLTSIDGTAPAAAAAGGDGA